MAASIVTQLIERVSSLPDHLQLQVLEYAQSLSTEAERGTPGKQLLEFAGAISRADLQAMESAIEAGCEQVDVHEW
jgi:hypothetical protein